jgi:hypothetical protein
LATSEIHAGICGFTTVVHAEMDGDECVLTINSDCPDIQRLADAVKRVDPMQEISWRGRPPRIMELAPKHCAHAACPVPAGIIKAVEVAAGLALPADATIKVSRD